MKVPKKAIAIQYAAAISGCLSATMFGATVGWASSALKDLSNGAQGFHLNSAQKSLIVAFSDLGNVLSPVPAGYLMDYIGRKKTILLIAFLYGLAFICILAAKQVAYLYFARVVVGLGKGLCYSSLPFFLTEIANTEIRGALSTMFIGFTNLGMMYNLVLGPLVSYETLNLCNAVIPVAMILTFWIFPESPYYLVMRGKKEKALESLSKYRWTSKDDEGLREEFEALVFTVERDMKNKGRFIDLISTNGNRRALVVVSLLSVLQRMSGVTTVLAYSPLIMPHRGGGIPSSYYMMILSLVLVLSNYAALPFVDWVGRKWLLIVSSFSTSVVMGTTAVFYYLNSLGDADISVYSWIPYACLLLFGFTYSIGIGFLPSTMVAELFPANVKSHAGAVSAILMAAVSFFVNGVFLHVHETLGVHVMFSIFCLSCLLGTFFIVFFVFETKGKSFAEIQDILTKESEKIVPKI